MPYGDDTSSSENVTHFTFSVLEKTCNVMNDHLPGFQMQAISCYFITLMLLINLNNIYIYICIYLFYVLNHHQIVLNVLNYYYKCIKYCHYE